MLPTGRQRSAHPQMSCFVGITGVATRSNHSLDSAADRCLIRITTDLATMCGAFADRELLNLLDTDRARKLQCCTQRRGRCLYMGLTFCDVPCNSAGSALRHYMLSSERSTPDRGAHSK